MNSDFILYSLFFILYSLSFILHPSSFILHPSSFSYTVFVTFESALG